MIRDTGICWHTGTHMRMDKAVWDGPYTYTQAILTLKSYINSKLNDESNQEIVQYLSAVLLRKWFLHSIAQ